ncbi:hypothetical protein BHE74_00033053 [Ensete ventricosum]|nr:hypothetical protein BHE74_00033053 [Ensete ventricosum]
MGGTYRSARLPVRGLPATGRFCQKSIVSDRLSEKKEEEEEEEKEEKKRNTYRQRAVLAHAPSPPAGRGCSFSRAGRKIEVTLPRLSPARGPRPCAVAACGSRVLFLPRGEKDRGDIFISTTLAAFVREGEKKCQNN